MIQTESTLTPEEVRIYLVLQYFFEELAILIEQTELLDKQRQRPLLITLP